MKKIIYTLLIMLISVSVFAQTEESPLSVEQLKQELVQEANLRYHLKLDVDNQKLTIQDLKRKVKASNDSLLRMQSVLDSICKKVGDNKSDFDRTTSNLRDSIDRANTAIDAKADNSDLQSKTTTGIVIVLSILVVLVLLFLILHNRIKKGSVDVEKLRQQSDELNERIVQSLNSEMEQMEKISKSLSLVANAKPKDAEPDHSLVKTLADRIAFMEGTLYRMDKSVRGYKQLSKSIAQMKENLMDKGYELVDLLGKEYNDGMKCIASFIEVDDIEQGRQIITSVRKPQINYNGIMIQASEIVVSQNS